MSKTSPNPPQQMKGERGTLVSKASFDRPSPRGELEAMARRRFQEPEPEKVGNWWQIRVYRDEYEDGREDQKTDTHQVGPCIHGVARGAEDQGGIF
jgi:hypothetical protein